MANSEYHTLFQQVGEVLSGVRGLRDMADIRQAQAEQLHDLLRSDLASLRREHGELREKFDCMVLMAQHDLELLRSSADEHSRAIDSLALATEGLRRPVRQILDAKSRLASLLFLAGALGSIALWLCEPVYRWLVDAALQRH